MLCFSATHSKRHIYEVYLYDALKLATTEADIVF